MNKQVKQIRDEVERLEKWSINVFTHRGGISTAIVSVLTDLLNFIDSIEEPEVNLNREAAWKPSDEQMEALEHFIIHHNGSTNYAKDLEELRIHLKKLKGE